MFLGRINVLRGKANMTVRLDDNMFQGASQSMMEKFLVDQFEEWPEHMIYVH